MTKVSLLDARPLMPSGAPTPRLAPPIAVRLLVCGNADRGDDAAALVAVAHVLPRLDDHIRWRVEVKRCNQLDAADLVDVPPNETCVVVDTVVGIPPGETITLPLEELGRAGHRVAPRSSHALPIDQVVGIASAVRGCVPTGVFVGIGGGHFGFGTRRSRALSSGMRTFERTIETEVRRLASAALVAGSGGHPGV